MGGWWHRLAVIDLSTGQTSDHQIDPEKSRAFIGGRGLGVHLVSGYVPPDTDPLSPDNIIVLATGPLTGTRAPTAGRSTLTTVSPLTGTVHDSNAGGRFGLEIKRNGYDAVLIKGKATEPVAIVIADGRIRIVEANSNWGQSTTNVSRWLSSLIDGRSATLCIGPGGVNGCSIASAIVDGRRAFARGGVGKVLGSKNLLGLVVKGSEMIDVADHDKFEFACYEAGKLLTANPITSKALPRFGTAVLINLMNELGVLPGLNFTQSSLAGVEKVSGEQFTARFLKSKYACWGCPIACGRTLSVGGQIQEGPEYESVWALGPNLGVVEPEPVIAANIACNEMGLDTISVGSTLACAMEAGTGHASFGDSSEIVGLIHAMAKGEGRGADMMHGAAEFASRHGCSELAMHSKGLELPAYDPRGMKGQGLGFATSNRGGCHLRANMLGPEIVGAPKLVDRFASEGRAGLVIYMQHNHAVVDSLVTCKFAGFALGDEHWSRLLSAATGVDYSSQDLQVCGERIWHGEKIFNAAAGVDTDELPHRLVSEPIRQGPCRGQVVELDDMLAEYYRFRGWSNDGRPDVSRLQRLGLGGASGEK